MSKLWIRSQDRKGFKQTKELWIGTEMINNHSNFNLYEEPKTFYTIVVDNERFARYETKERALQILDEIQSLLIGKVLVEPKQTKTKKEDSILEAQPINIKPINKDFIVYELPIK